ncbi:polysulfide reductase NrfD family protein [Limnobaculum xujianqingii]|uniref:NrfD/PsrC family molybdoenzyme membrane anchor subunit n=1 Tax=Limnobaculum xujianqingii TaxID=2738837 RepID=UPI00112968D6|nr:NrfD/PsrC family molybdoenzyme membrane anchor subunit [Limnobaculum xujianqingii]
MQTKTLYHPVNLLAIVGVAAGGYVAIDEWFFQSSFRTNDGIVWTLPLISYIFLALMSTGVSILLAAGKIGRIEILEKNTKHLLCLAIGALLGAFAALSTEMGSPLNIYWLIFSPNLTSPIWWMGTLYFIELILLAVKFFELYTNKHVVNERVLAWLTAIVAISAALVLGSVFGTVIGRVSYVGLSASVFTLLAALASGIALVTMLSAQAVRQFIMPYFRLALAILLVFLIAGFIYQIRSTVDNEVITVSAISLILLVAAIFLASHTSVMSAVLALAGILYAEYKFVIGGQLFTLGPKAAWFGVEQNYLPNIYEYGVLILGIAFAWLAYSVLYRVLNK